MPRVCCFITSKHLITYYGRVCLQAWVTEGYLKSMNMIFMACSSTWAWCMMSQTIASFTSGSSSLTLMTLPALPRLYHNNIPTLFHDVNSYLSVSLFTSFPYPVFQLPPPFLLIFLSSISPLPLLVTGIP